nr:reverse transcriptase domain-containing protein [Tanacetum cinerariifolium]
MRTRSSSNQIVESSTILRRRNKHSQQQVVPTIVEIPVVTMVDNRTMEEMLQAPTEGYGDAIVVPDILANFFEVRTGLFSLIQANQFHGFESNNPHDHIRSFNRITSTLMFRNVSNDAIKLMLFPYSLEGAAKICNTLSACVATGTYNQRGPQNRASNQMGPPRFPPVQNNNQNHFNQNQGNNVNRGNNCQGNQGFQAQTNHALNFQVPNNQSPPKVVFLMMDHLFLLLFLLSPRWLLEVTKDAVQLSTENIQHPVVQTQVQIDEPVDAPKPKPTIPYPSRANKQKLREKDDILALKFVEIFRNLHFNLSFVDALLHMPKFALMFKSLLNNKEKLFELATTSVNENCSVVILKKLPEKLEDPDKFLIPFVDYVVDPRVPLILGRPFLRTGRALIDVYDEELTLRDDDESITFKVGQTLKYSHNDAKSIYQIDVIDVACEEYVQEEEIETFLRISDELPNLDDDYYDTEGDIIYLEKLLNKDPSLNLPSMKNKDLKQVDATMINPSIKEPPELELKELPSHLEYAFLERTDKLPVRISKELKDKEKYALLKVLKSHKYAIAWKISDIKCNNPLFQ